MEEKIENRKTHRKNMPCSHGAQSAVRSGRGHNEGDILLYKGGSPFILNVCVRFIFIFSPSMGCWIHQCPYFVRREKLDLLAMYRDASRS